MKIFLIAAVSFLLLLVFIFLLKGRIDIVFKDQSFFVTLKFLFIRYVILSPDKKKNKSHNKTSKNKPSSAKQLSKDVFDLKKILNLLSFARDSLKKIGMTLDIDKLILHAAVGKEGDAAATAMMYGAGAALVSSFLPTLETSFKIKKHDIQIDADFSGSQYIYLNIIISAVLYRLLFAALSVFSAYKKMEVNPNE